MPNSLDDAAATRGVPARLQLMLVLLPVAAAYAILARFFTAVPLLDDYEQIFVFALQFARMPTLAGKFGLLLTTQVSAYKLVFEHLLAALQIVCFGHMNFAVLVWICNLTPALIFVLIWRHLDGDHAPARGRLLFLLPASLLLFSLNWAETLDWAACGLQYQIVIFFSLAALHFLVRPFGSGWSLLAAVACGILATSAFPNGMLVWPVGVLFLLLQARSGHGLLLRLCGWSAGFAVSLAGYLYHYQRVGIVSKGTLPAKLLYAVMFCGSAIENMHHRPVPFISVAVGLAVLAAFVDAVRTEFYRRNPFVFYSTLWVLLTSLVVANARVGYGLNQSLSSRYKVYCDLLLVFTYIYLLDRFRSAGAPTVRRLLGASIAVAAVVCVGGDVAGGRLLKSRQQRAGEAMAQYLAAPQSASPMFLFEDKLNPGELAVEDKARIELNEAIRLGIYVPPPPR
jgi:hypothetical protein